LGEETESGISAAAVSKPARRWRWWAVGAAGAALSAAIFLLLPRETQAPVKEVPLTSFPGYQGEPALSPDGSQFAFVWDGGQENTPTQLYVSLVGRGTPLRLTNTAGAAVHYPVWSSDGQMIACVRQVQGGKAELIVIPALGGPERRIDEVSPYSLFSSSPGAPAWSPDGKWIYFSAPISSQARALFAAPATGGQKRRLIDPPPEAKGDGSPSISPDGRQLVFVRFFADYNADLFVADLRDGNTAGTPRRLTNDHRSTYSPVWTTDGQDVIYIAGEATSLLGIYRVRFSGGRPKRIEGIGGDYPTMLAIAPKGHRLAYSRAVRDYNIYRVPLATSGGFAGAPAKFLSSTRFEESPAYSPDGKRIVFASNRSGVRQIWIADADGSNPLPLTNFTGGIAGSPRWSPDGQTIVFDARPEGLADIYSLRADGGAPKRLTDNPAEDHVPCYSADGRTIYFASTRSGQPQLYRITADGGEATQITHKGAGPCMASTDGKWVYYGKPGATIWRVRPDGGEENPVAEIPRIVSTFSFYLAASGIYFASPPDPASGATTLKLYRFADGKTVEVGRIDKPLRLHLSVSPDEKWLAWAQLDNSIDDLMLVENFR
jgi:Tol biopolymer transport system component